MKWVSNKVHHRSKPVVVQLPFPKEIIHPIALRSNKCFNTDRFAKSEIPEILEITA